MSFQQIPADRIVISIKMDDLSIIPTKVTLFPDVE